MQLLKYVDQEKHHKILYIGIDPGSSCGIAMGADKKILHCVTVYTGIHNVFIILYTYLKMCDKAIIYVEDPYQRSGPSERAQGAGYIKGLTKQIRLWLKDASKQFDIEYHFIGPIRNGTKLSDHVFRQITGFERKTSEHARDAGMIVWTKMK